MKRRALTLLGAALTAGAMMTAVASAHVVNSPGTSQALHAGDTNVPAHEHLFGTADIRTDGVQNGQLNVGP